MRHEAARRCRTAVMLDPHPLCHTALEAVLAPENIELVGATTSIRTALDLLREHTPDLFVLEIDIPGRREDVLAMIETACREHPGMTVVVLSATDDRDLIDAAFDRGVRAYVLKCSEQAVLVTGILQAFEQSLYLAATPADGPATRLRERMLMKKLTRREIEILQLVSGGLSNRQVGELLYVTDQTVKFHLANVYRKLGVRSRFEAALWAQEQGLVDDASFPTVVKPPKEAWAAPRRATNGVLVPLHPRQVRHMFTEARETSQ